MTAEFALVLPAVTVLLVGVLLAGSFVMAQQECAAAARAGARAAALGDDDAAVRAVVGQAGGIDDVSIDRAGGNVTITVHTAVDIGVMGIGRKTVEVKAHALCEPDVDCGGGG